MVVLSTNLGQWAGVRYVGIAFRVIDRVLECR